MAIKLKTAKAHEMYLNNAKFKSEFETLSTAFSEHSFPLQAGTINAVILGVEYVNVEKKALVSVVFVNMTGRPVNEIHAKLFVDLKNTDAQMATTTFDFDSEFLGTVENEEGIFLNINIPVKGLKEDRTFLSSEYMGRLDDVRITFSDTNDFNNAGE